MGLHQVSSLAKALVQSTSRTDNRLFCLIGFRCGISRTSYDIEGNLNAQREMLL